MDEVYSNMLKIHHCNLFFGNLTISDIRYFMILDHGYELVHGKMGRK